MRLGKRRNGEERDAQAQLVEAGALSGIRPSRVRREGGAEQLRILHAGVVRAEGIHRTFRPAARQFAGRGVGQVGALSGRDSIRCPCPALMGCGRGHMVVKAAVLVIHDEDYRILPAYTVANRVDHLRNKCLSALDVGGRMFVVFGRFARQPEIGIHKRDFRKRPSRDVGEKAGPVGGTDNRKAAACGAS